MSHAPIDITKLQKDARAYHKKAGASSAGTTRLLREHLDTIDKLRSDGVTFAAIAEALAAQGVMQGKGEKRKPITASRLTTLYGQLKRTDAQREGKRKARTDASSPAINAQRAGNHKDVSLAPELARQPLPVRREVGMPDEEEIRRKRNEVARRYVKSSRREE